MTTELLPVDIREKFEVHEWKHACAVLASDFPEQWQDIIDVLRGFRCAKQAWQNLQTERCLSHELTVA